MDHTSTESDVTEKRLAPEEQAVLAAENALFQEQTLHAQLQMALSRIATLSLENHRLRHPVATSPVED